MAAKRKSFTELYSGLEKKGLMPAKEYYHLIRARIPAKSEYYDETTVLLVVAYDVRSVLSNAAAAVESVLPFKPPEYQLQTDLQTTVRNDKRIEEFTKLRDETDVLYLTLSDELLFKDEYNTGKICMLVNESIEMIKKINVAFNKLYGSGASMIKKRLEEEKDDTTERNAKTYFG